MSQSPLLRVAALLGTLIVVTACELEDDCDTDVDVDRDMLYRKHVSDQVKQYTEYVRALTKAKANAALMVGLF
jgi:hypothetical protein